MQNFGMHYRPPLLIATALCLLSLSANAALFSRAGGQAYYDDELNITWVADANLAKTSGYDTDGRMGRNLAQLWIDYLNVTNYLGVNDWRLPTNLDTDGPDPDALGNDGCAVIAYTGTDCGYNVQTKSGATVYSEMAHLYYVTLGNPSRYDESGVATGCFDAAAGFPDYCLSNAGPFANLHGDMYWSGTGYVPLLYYYWWSFWFGAGLQYYFDDATLYYAWAVRSGDMPFDDADSDGVADAIDNCTGVANPTQLDADGAGYGNICDGDLNNSGLTTAQDNVILRNQLNQPSSANPTAAAADLNDSGLVTAQDNVILRNRLNLAPGPSGLACAGTVPCP